LILDNNYYLSKSFGSAGRAEPLNYESKYWLFISLLRCSAATKTFAAVSEFLYRRKWASERQRRPLWRDMPLRWRDVLLRRRSWDGRCRDDYSTIDDWRWQTRKIMKNKKLVNKWKDEINKNHTRHWFEIIIISSANILGRRVGRSPQNINLNIGFSSACYDAQRWRRHLPPWANSCTDASEHLSGSDDLCGGICLCGDEMSGRGEDLGMVGAATTIRQLTTDDDKRVKSWKIRS